MLFNLDADAKRKFRQRFRETPGGLAFSRSPGGEGRPVSAQEGRTFTAEYDALIDHTGKQRGTIFRCLIIALLFHVLGYALRSIPLFMLTVWTVYALGIWLIVTFIGRMRGKHANWHLVERRTIIAPLSGEERIKRGYKIALRDWLWIIPLVIVIEALRIPAGHFEEMFGSGSVSTMQHWLQTTVLAGATIVVVPIALIVIAFRVWHWWRTRLGSRS